MDSKRQVLDYPAVGELMADLKAIAQQHLAPPTPADYVEALLAVGFSKDPPPQDGSMIVALAKIPFADGSHDVCQTAMKFKNNKWCMFVELDGNLRLFSFTGEAQPEILAWKRIAPAAAMDMATGVSNG